MARQTYLMRSVYALAAVLAVPVWAGEYAVLGTGFRIHADAYERDGDKLRLFTSGGVIELPASQFVGFESEDPPPPPPVAPEPPPPPAEKPGKEVSVPALLRGAAERHGLPPELLDSVARAESGYRPNAISPKGAIGVMQLMPGTAATLDANPFDAAENIEAGTRLLRDLLVKYDGSTHRALAAYNAGAGAVDRHNGIPPYRETQLYVDRVLSHYLRQMARKSTASSQSE